MADSDSLRRYQADRSYPTIPGGEGKFTTEELRRIATAINALVDVVKKIDARLIAHGI